MLMVNKNLNEQVEKTINTSQVPRPRSQCLKTLPPGWSFNLTMQKLTWTQRVNYERVTMKRSTLEIQRKLLLKTGKISLADCDKHEFQKDFHSDCLSDTKGWEQGQRLVPIV